MKHERHRIFTSFPSNRHSKSFVLKNTFIQVLAKALLLLAKVALPVLPFIFGFIFLKPEYILNYCATIQKLKIHHKALSQGPVRRYFESFFAVRLNEASQISGACTQCGIYNSPFRKLSNCGAFPISGEDIERYDCPGYVLNPKTVIKIAVVN